MFAGDLAAHLLAFGHDAGRGLFGFFQHVGVVGVDRDVHMAVAVTGMHVAGHHDAAGFHVIADLADLLVQMGVLLAHAGQKGLGALPELGIGKLGLRVVAGRHLGGKGELAVEFLVFHGEAGQAAHFLQGVAVGLGRAFQVELFEEEGEVRDAVHGDDHVLVELEAGGALGDGRQAVPVFPEAFAFLVVLGHDDVHVVLFFHHADDVVDALVQQVGVVTVHLEDDDRDGQALILLGLALVLDGLHVLGVEFFQGGQMGVVAFLTDAVAQAHQLAHHHGGGVHGAAEEFQHHDALELGLGMDDEAGLGDDAVHAFLLHAGQAAQGLVGHVLAQAGQADLVAAQVDDVAHAAADVLDHEHGRFFGQDLVAGMVLAFHADDLARGGDHAPPEQVVQGGAVFEGAGAAGVFGDVAADGRGLLGGRVHGEECPGRVHGLDDVLGDGAGFHGDGHVLKVDGADLGQTGEADDDRTLAGRHGAAGHAGAAAARDEGKLHVVGQLHQGSHLLGAVGFHHQQGQFHAQVRGVRGRGHQGGGRGKDALVGQDVAQGGDQLFAEAAFGLVSGPEHGDAFADGVGEIVGQGHGFPFEAGVHAVAHGLHVDEGVVGHQEQFFGNGNGQMPHRLGPLREVVDIDTQDAVDHIVR